MQVIDLGDDMHFEVLPRAERDELSCNMEDVPTDESNLVIRVSCIILLFPSERGIQKTCPLAACHKRLSPWQVMHEKVFRRK